MNKNQYLYVQRPYYQWFSERLDEALQTARTLSIIINEPDSCSLMENAAIAIAPSSLSIASSLRMLVAEGYTPSARLLVRPLLERTATLDYVVNDEAGLTTWSNGWKRNERPSLSKLLSRLDNSEDHDPATLQTWIVDDLNSVIHPDLAGLDSLRSPTHFGTDAHWFESHPEDYDTADTVCSAAAMCAVYITSNIKRAFHEKIRRFEVPKQS